jgi:hypothetical protein
MMLDELQGKETVRHKGNREGKEVLTGGESSDELTRTKTEQIEEEEGFGIWRKMRKRRRRRRSPRRRRRRRRIRRGWRTEETKGPLRSFADTHSPRSDTSSTNNSRRKMRLTRTEHRAAATLAFGAARATDTAARAPDDPT